MAITISPNDKRPWFDAKLKASLSRGTINQGAQADSVATTVADVVTDFNALLAKLRTAGLIS